MISIFKLHFYYLYSWKVIYVSFILILISIVSYLLFSKFYLDYDLLVFNREYYLEEYYFESINYLKIILVMFNLFIVINSFILNKYDIFLLIRISKKQVIVSKIVTLFIGSTIFTLILYLLFIITGLFLTPYMRVSIVDLSILGDLVIFGGVYLLIYSLIYFYNKGIYSLLIVVIGYFISDITIEYYVIKSSVSDVSKLINLIFINVGYYQDEGYSLYYGKMWGIILLISLFIGIVSLYKKMDIEN